MEFYDKLQKLRRERGLSQEALANLLSVSRQSVSKWENGQAYPETEKLIMISEMFGVTVDSLLKNSEIQTDNPNPVTYVTVGSSFNYEYKSKKELFGLPLVHINVGLGVKKAKGIIAIGNISQGFLSIGLLSIGLLSIGLLGLGLVSLSLLALGLVFALGTVSIGIFSLGAVAIGVFTLGAVSLGMYSVGALSVASHVAIGDNAHAPIAVGQTIATGIREFVSQTGRLADISADEVRQAILDEFPNTSNRIVDWLVGFLGR